MKPCDLARSSVVSAKAMREAPVAAKPAAARLSKACRRETVNILDIDIPFPCLLDEVHNSSGVMYTSLLDLTQEPCRMAFRSSAGRLAGSLSERVVHNMAENGAASGSGVYQKPFLKAEFAKRVADVKRRMEKAG